MPGALTPTDLAAAVEVIDRLYGNHHEDDFPARAMQLVGELVRTDVTSFNDIDPTRERLVVQIDPQGFPMGPGLDVLARLAPEHPLLRHYEETGDGSAVKVSDFLTTEGFHATALYTEFYSHLGVEHQMSITLPARRPRVVAIALNRTELGDDFDERDRSMLNFLRPHLARAYRMARDRARMQGDVERAGKALAERGTAVLVLESTVRELTPGATASLVDYFGPPEGDGELPEAVATWVEAMRGRQAAESEQIADGAAFPPLSAKRGSSRLVVRFLPDDPHDWLLLVERPAALAPSELESLGLTPREAEVLSAVVYGRTNTEVADFLGIADGTVRTHLEHVYRKLGVNSRGAATAAVLDLLSASQQAGA